MRSLLLIACLVLLAAPTLAFDLGPDRGDKPAFNTPQNVPDPERQGGDTIADAVVITLPLIDGSGTTAGYNDDYDETCPYGGSTSPDVVYTVTPVETADWDIDLLGSTYDTKVYVYDQDLSLVACNDDWYPDYTSKLEALTLLAGVTYSIVVDGYGGDFGDYVINITFNYPCDLACWNDADLEGEPPLVDGYEDAFNAGCGGDGGWSTITSARFCGISGWYLSSDGSSYRDTDWFQLVVPTSGVIEIVGIAEYATYMFELGPQDCSSVAVLQNVLLDPCEEGTISIPGEPGSTAWFWVGPSTFEGPVNEYLYALETNLGVVATENHSWSAIKGMF